MLGNVYSNVDLLFVLGQESLSWVIEETPFFFKWSNLFALV